MPLTSLSEMIAFKKSGHDTSASLAKMLWEPGTNLKGGYYTPGQMVSDAIDYNRDMEEIHNDRMQDEFKYGGYGGELPKRDVRGVDVPRNSQGIAPIDAVEFANEERYKREFGEGEPSMEEVFDAQYRLDHPEDNEGVPPEKDKALVGS